MMTAGLMSDLVLGGYLPDDADVVDPAQALVLGHRCQVGAQDAVAGDTQAWRSRRR